VSGVAVDTLTDFDPTMNALTDKLSLGDLLVGEHADAASLDAFLDIASDGTNTTVDVRPGGSGTVTQQIVLQGVDLPLGNSLTELQVIDNLLNAGKLTTDP